jgi:hypothetical protein
LTSALSADQSFRRRWPPAGPRLYVHFCEDLKLLANDGFTCGGWDPVFQPDAARQEADVVNLGYVINVVEKPVELCWCAQLVSPSVLMGLNAVRRSQPISHRLVAFGACKAFAVGELRALR